MSPQSGSQTGTATTSTAPIRIFFLLDSFMIGGTETQAVELARRLDPSRYQVTIGCLRREGPLLERLKNTPVEITEVNLGGGIDSPSGLIRIAKLARFLRRNKIQILHAHDLWSNIVGMAAAILARTQVTITSQRDLSHDAWYGTYKRKVLRFCQRRSSLLLTNAKAIRDGLIEQDHLPPEKVCVVYNGVDLDRFERARESQSAFSRQRRQQADRPRRQHDHGCEGSQSLLSRRARSGEGPPEDSVRAGRRRRHAPCFRKAGERPRSGIKLPIPRDAAAMFPQSSPAATSPFCPRWPRVFPTRSWNTWPQACRWWQQLSAGISRSLRMVKTGLLVPPAGSASTGCRVEQALEATKL